MIDEKKAEEEMRRDPNLRSDLFTLKRVSEVTELSRTMLIKLEKEGFITPRAVDSQTGWRYFDTFNIFKLLQYKRLRMTGLTQNEIFEFYETGNESLVHTLKQMQRRQRLLNQSIEMLSLRIDKKRNYSFSFYDFDELTCLTLEGEVMNLAESGTLGYNLSAEAIALGLRPLATEELFCENADRYTLTGKESKAPWHIKIYQPIDPDHKKGAADKRIEVIPACRTFSILLYGLRDIGDTTKPHKLLLEEIKKRGLVPTGAPIRVQAVVANYTAMHLGGAEHVLRLAMPVKESVSGRI